MRTLALLLALMAPVGAAGEGMPALHDVTGVAAGDVLNVRARPDASAPILGVLDPEATGVEVVAADGSGRWGQVNLAGEAGWASLRYLSRQPGQDAGTFPRVAACFGTEPFWNLRLDGDVATWSEPEREASGQVEARIDASARPDRHGLVARIDGTPLMGVIAARTCSDGMSDRAFGLAFDAIFGDAVLSGCCTLAR